MSGALRYLEKNQIPPKKHNHVGSMMFEDMVCWCTECGQKWRRYVTDDDYSTGWITEQTLVEARKRNARKRRRR